MERQEKREEAELEREKQYTHMDQQPTVNKQQQVDKESHSKPLKVNKQERKRKGGKGIFFLPPSMRAARGDGA